MWVQTIGDWREKGTTTYRVKLSKPGPRGGKRPPLLVVDVYAQDQEQAITRAKKYLARRLKVEVMYW